mmetsp:Transcript_3783/g.7274  ORF Transcript_3783/g.7274 Transcript_3783/m.7274 type:complete len:82 (+) Transcript_3783:287-532(+)
MFMLDVQLAKNASARIPIAESHELGVYVVQGRVASGAEEATLDVGDASIYNHERKAKEAQSSERTCTCICMYKTHRSFAQS